ncbi:hypothetical protein GJAV_G00258420 [Gymnothorax javanicus]|nr:hypothetical protein GJAV_G00258420 [Gymnothorax javanicus]
MLATGAAVSTALAQVDREKIYQWINELSSPETRENALLELSKKRESVPDLAPMLWHSCGTIAALLQEIVNIYPSINPPTLTAHQSNRVCNALALLQCVASHPETRSAFLAAHIPLFLYPFLHTVSKTRPFEYLRLTSLGVIGALVKTDEQEVINFLLTTEIIPLCLRIMESGSELSKTVATFILQKILLDDTGLAYICQTYERFSHVAMILGKMVLQLSKEPSARLLKHVVRCYLRLSDNPRAREALRQCLPDQLKDTTFAQVLKDDTTTKRWLAQLVKNLQEGQITDSRGIPLPPQALNVCPTCPLFPSPISLQALVALLPHYDVIGLQEPSPYDPIFHLTALTHAVRRTSVTTRGRDITRAHLCEEMASMASSSILKGNHGNAYLKPLMVGSTMQRVKSRSRYKQRYFKLQDDGTTICELAKEDGKALFTFSVGDLESVREGHQSEVLQSIADEFPADRCFTLVFRGRRANLDLVAITAAEAQTWIKGVQKLMEHLESMTPKERMDQWISDWFRKADKNKDGRMNFKEVRDLLKMMNIDMNEHHALHLFRMADKSKSETLEDEEFVVFYKMLTKREDVLRVFKDYSGDGEKLSLLDLEDFLRDEQQETDSSQERARDVINRYEPSEAAKKLPAMSIDGFLMYLSSAEGSIFNPQQQAIYQDMTQPLSHYFISCSHNTYLLEDQLLGQSSVEGYIRALKRGCRCVELDCWDGPNGEPIIYHGHTLTSKILLKDVIVAVEKYAFKASEYPLILSMENHCGVEQQTVIAEHLQNILGDKLLKNPADSKFVDGLPSPQELMGKILIKGKKIGRMERSPSRSGRAEDPNTAAGVAGMPNRETKVDRSPNRLNRVEKSPSRVARVEETQNNSAQVSMAAAVSDEEDSDDSAEENAHHADRPKTCKQHLSRQLSDCVVYCKTVPFTSFEHSRLRHKFYEMSSFTESKARKLIRSAGNDFVYHNARRLIRVYPGGLRTDSSNFHPQDMWNVGCQLVALNFQTAGEEMDLNDGLFSQNGRCGYVLKPKFLRSCESRFDPENPRDCKEYQPVRLAIQVISGQQFPKVSKKEGSIVDPLVRVEVHGVPLDQSKQETRHIDNNGFNPMWYDTVQFQLHAPELALVRFVVEDYDHASKNDFIGQYTLPFTCIQPGYRHVPLLSKDGTSLSPSSLFVHIRITKLTEGKVNSA